MTKASSDSGATRLEYIAAKMKSDRRFRHLGCRQTTTGAYVSLPGTRLAWVRKHSGETLMRDVCRFLRLVGISLALSVAAGRVHATDLRIALRDDPDVLDPTLATTYTGRIVFAGLCDKLFDI